MANLEKIEKFTEVLSEAGQELVPVNYRLMEKQEARTVLAVGPKIPAESNFYHTNHFECYSYYKPISKCCTEDE